MAFPQLWGKLKPFLIDLEAPNRGNRGEEVNKLHAERLNERGLNRDMR
jgi:hypothetical protein